MKPSVIALLLTVVICAGFDKSSASGYLLGIGLAVVVLVYLIISLIKPEKF